MIFTTTTEIARKWSKVFDWLTYATVLNNNADIWMIIWWELYKAILEKGIIEDLLEDIEMNKNSKNLKTKYENSLKSGLSSLKI